MAASARAWLLDVGGPCRIAVGEHELVEVLERPRPFELPIGPPHCRRVIVWRKRILPLVDPSRLGQPLKEGRKDPPFTLVAAYQKTLDDPVEYGAVLVSSPPANIRVSDEAATDLPPDLPAEWQDLAISCFQENGDPVLVPDLALLFDPPV